MSELSMTRDEREAFLADLHVGVLSVERPEGPPFTCPIWYRYEPGGVIEMVTEGSSTKVALLRDAGRASFCVQHEREPFAYVTVYGSVTAGPSTLEDRTAIATRYLGDEAASAFVAVVDDDILLRLTPERWATADFAKFAPR